MDMAEVVVLETRDLIRYQAQLPSKAELIMHFEEYIKLTRSTSGELSDYFSHLGRSVDRIISMNRHTLRLLGSFKDQQASNGIARNMFGGLGSGYYGKLNEVDIIRQYLKQADMIEEQADGLIAEGTTLQLHLQNLEDHLDIIRATANRDSAILIDHKDELFSRFWTILGGNSRDKKRLQKNIAISDRVITITRAATQNVKLALDELRRLKNDMVDLKARISVPRNNAKMTALEIEEHIKYVTDGVEKLNDMRIEGRKEIKKTHSQIAAHVKSLYDDVGGGQPKKHQLGS